MTSSRDDIIKELDRSGHWLIAAHVKPDGDTLGCAIALAKVALRIGKRSTVLCADDFPDRYSFLYDGVDMQKYTQSNMIDTVDGPIVICVDTSRKDRSIVPLIDNPQGITVISIDHHIDTDSYSDMTLIEHDASSTAEVVTRLLDASPWGIAKDEADALYTAMVTDNGYFCFASTSPCTHECAGKLLRSGAEPHVISEHLESTLSENALKLWGLAFSHIELFADVCAVMHLTKEDFETAGAKREDTETLVNYLLRIKGIKLCALAVETDHGTKFSVRSRAPFSARDVAVRFGGGGHELASGCMLGASMSDAMRQVRRQMEIVVETRLSADR